MPTASFPGFLLLSQPLDACHQLRTHTHGDHGCRRHIPLTHFSLEAINTWHKPNRNTMKSMRRSTSTTQDLHLSVSSLSLCSSSSTSSSDSEEDAVIHNVVANIQQVKRKAIQFGRVTIIEFPYALGDNPSVSSGPPISMGPIHQDRFSVDLLEYDDAKLSIHRRSIPEMRMDQMLRTHILQSSGHTLREIMQATIEAQDHRELRRQSVQSSSTHLMLYSPSPAIRILVLLLSPQYSYFRIRK